MKPCRLPPVPSPSPSVAGKCVQLNSLVSAIFFWPAPPSVVWAGHPRSRPLQIRHLPNRCFAFWPSISSLARELSSYKADIVRHRLQPPSSLCWPAVRSCGETSVPEEGFPTLPSTEMWLERADRELPRAAQCLYEFWLEQLPPWEVQESALVSDSAGEIAQGGTDHRFQLNGEPMLRTGGIGGVDLPDAAMRCVERPECQ